jgi:hypothetical protein
MNDQFPMSNVPVTNTPNLPLVIGHSGFTAHWSLVIGHFVLLLLTGLAARADETNPVAVAGADTNLAVPRLQETNPPALNIAETNSTVSGAADTNSALAKPLDTNSAILSAVDTNSVVFSTMDTNSAALREARSVVPLDLQSFRLIWERNIFNPNRSPGRYTTRVAPTFRRDDGTRRRTESFALVGTMSYEKGRFAFFESSNYQYQKVLETSNTIAGYTIADITPTHVKLESTNGQAIKLPVGMQMKKEDEGEWSVSERPQSSEGYGRSSVSSGSSGAEASEVLKRLMQKRDQEGNTEATNTADVPLASQENPVPETTETTNKLEKPDPAPAAGADEILKRLLQKREQEVNR